MVKWPERGCTLPVFNIISFLSIFFIFFFYRVTEIYTFLYSRIHPLTFRPSFTTLGYSKSVQGYQVYSFQTIIISLSLIESNSPANSS